jgi:hypothetical protein
MLSHNIFGYQTSLPTIIAVVSAGLERAQDIAVDVSHVKRLHE